MCELELEKEEVRVYIEIKYGLLTLYPHVIKDF